VTLDIALRPAQLLWLGIKLLGRGDRTTLDDFKFVYRVYKIDGGIYTNLKKEGYYEAEVHNDTSIHLTKTKSYKFYKNKG
jgi:hypothetical protein